MQASFFISHFTVLCFFQAMWFKIRATPIGGESAINTSERRREIIVILFSRTEKVKINDLVARFGTCRRTIRYDVEILSLTYQIGSTPGRHGGIYIDSPIHSQPRYLTPEEAAALLHMLSYIQEKDKTYLKSILRDLARIDRL